MFRQENKSGSSVCSLFFGHFKMEKIKLNQKKVDEKIKLQQKQIIAKLGKVYIRFSAINKIRLKQED